MENIKRYLIAQQLLEKKNYNKLIYKSENSDADYSEDEHLIYY